MQAPSFQTIGYCELSYSHYSYGHCLSSCAIFFGPMKTHVLGVCNRHNHYLVSCSSSRSSQGAWSSPPSLASRFGVRLATRHMGTVHPMEHSISLHYLHGSRRSRLCERAAAKAAGFGGQDSLGCAIRVVLVLRERSASKRPQRRNSPETARQWTHPPPPLRAPVLHLPRWHSLALGAVQGTRLVPREPSRSRN
jgi:hypothetical protein